MPAHFSSQNLTTDSRHDRIAQVYSWAILYSLAQIKVNTLINPLRLNVGFIKQQSIGYSRSFPFNYVAIHLHPDLDLDDLIGNAKISRTPQGLLVEVALHAALPSECGHCLTTLQLTLDVNFTELYAFSPENATEPGLILPEDGYMDLGPVAREYILLEVPISPICQLDCKGLCPTCGGNLNESDCEHGGPQIDPRLEILKSLLLE